MIQTAELYGLFKQTQGICTDSRQILRDSLFVAIRGQHFDGNDYALEALSDGAMYSLVDRLALKDEPGCIYVPNTLTSLQRLARHHRDHFDIPVLAITGSNGKTTTKELVREVLNQGFRVHATIGNLNNHLGVPLTLLQMPDDVEIAVIEMGANHRGEINWLCHIANPNQGLITNIGSAHIEGFGSKEGVAISKTELYRFLDATGGQILVNHDEPSLQPWVQPSLQGITRYGQDRLPGGLQRVRFSTANAHLQMTLEVDSDKVLIKSHLYGTYNKQNVTTALAIGGLHGLTADQLKAGIENYRPANNRSQIIEAGDQTLYLDAYNANPTSMDHAISFFATIPKSNKILVLGDMMELGEKSEQLHEEIIRRCLTNQSFRRLVFVGEIFGKALANHIDHQRVFWMEDVEICMAKYKIWSIPQSQVLIKGSRKMQLERLLEVLLPE